MRLRLRRRRNLFFVNSKRLGISFHIIAERSVCVPVRNRDQEGRKIVFILSFSSCCLHDKVHTDFKSFKADLTVCICFLRCNVKIVVHCDLSHCICQVNVDRIQFFTRCRDLACGCKPLIRFKFVAVINHSVCHFEQTYRIAAAHRLGLSGILVIILVCDTN